MIVAIAPAVVLIVGLLMWFVSANPKVSEAGRLMFFVGLFVLTWMAANETFKIG